MAHEINSTDSEQVINQAIERMRQLNGLALRGEDLTDEASEIRQDIYRQWLRLDAKNRVRLQEAQGEFMKELISPGFTPHL
jgi:hypothetical protein